MSSFVERMIFNRTRNSRGGTSYLVALLGLYGVLCIDEVPALDHRSLASAGTAAVDKSTEDGRGSRPGCCCCGSSKWMGA